DARGFGRLHNYQADRPIALQRGNKIWRRMLNRDLSIVIVDDNRIRAQIIEDGLREAGHSLVTVVDSSEQPARHIAELAPDVVFIDLENPSRVRLVHYISLSRALRRTIAVIVDRANAAAIEAAREAVVSAYVLDGVKNKLVKPLLDFDI